MANRKDKNNGGNLGFEAELFKTADKLRGNMEPSDYKHVALGRSSRKPHMGLTSWERAPDGKILKTDVVVAKNYLEKGELESLGRIVNAYLDLAEERAQRRIPMTMEDWAKRLDSFLEFTEREIGMCQ